MSNRITFKLNTKMIRLSAILFCAISGSAYTPSVILADVLSLDDSRSQAASTRWLAQADEDKPISGREAPRSGTLLLPDSPDPKEHANEKRCMTVCNRWGEDCIYDPQRGRQCRRTCKDFEEQCF